VAAFCGCTSASASRSSAAAVSPVSVATRSRAGPSASGGTIARFTIRPITAPIAVSRMRSNAYPGVAVPRASTSIALIAIWFAVPGVARNAHATSSAHVTARATAQNPDPSSSPIADATMTPAMTPTVRSTPRPNDWLMLGCTVSSAAIAANTGGGPSTSHPAISQAAPVATADLTTCSSEDRWAARSDQFIPSRYAARAAAARDRAPRPRRAQTP